MTVSSVRVEAGPLPGTLLLSPPIHRDERGEFQESFNAREFQAATGLEVRFVQDNTVRSARGVLRGLHLQIGSPQGKLVRVVSGSVFDVVLDLRGGSPTYGHAGGCTLVPDGPQLWVPPGFAHGYLVLSDRAEVCYKVTAYREVAAERVIQARDPGLGVVWPEVGSVRMSARDAEAPRLADCPGLIAD